MMELTKEEYRNFVEILKEELTPAFGCTEPIAIAYCAAKARETLGCLSLIHILFSSAHGGPISGRLYPCWKARTIL